MTKLFIAIIFVMLATIILVNLDKAEKEYCKAILSDLNTNDKLTVEQSQCLADL